MSEPPELGPPDYAKAELAERLRFLEIGADDEALLRELGAELGPRLPGEAEAFYRFLAERPQTAPLLTPELVARLSARQAEYLASTLAARYDADYFRARWQIGRVHNRVHVAPQWFIGAFALHKRLLLPHIFARWGHDPQACMARVLALEKAFNLDMQLGIESYIAHYVAGIDALRSANAQIGEASAAKSLFLANMSHEFRTPLNAILGFAEVLQDGLAGPLTGEQAEYLDDIHRAGQVLLRLISDVLDIAKIEAGRLELFYEDFPILPAVREALATLRGQAEKKGLTLRLDAAGDLGAITADPIRFKQILYNLLSNAVKFTEHGVITVGLRSEGDMLHMVVRDTGVGISPQEQQRIFREFSQVNGSHARRAEGTGLGLALSKRLVEAHDGRIWLESESGQGSAFHVLLPLVPAGSAGQGGRQG